VHDEAPRAEDTDWPQILALYGLLERVAPSPMVTLNRAVATARVQGPEAGLDLVATLDVDSTPCATPASSSPQGQPTPNGFTEPVSRRSVTLLPVPTVGPP
jgi:hypothetical protein